jgi:hypothetical protein
MMIITITMGPVMMTNLNNIVSSAFSSDHVLSDSATSISTSTILFLKTKDNNYSKQ